MTENKGMAGAWTPGPLKVVLDGTLTGVWAEVRQECIDPDDKGRQTVNLPGFTPGPWFASEMGTDRSFWDALAADDVQIVRTNWDGFSGDVIAAVWADDDSDEAANARLIASAPDLLEALTGLVAQVSQDGKLWVEIESLLKKARFPVAPLKEAVAAANAAISRATGKDSA